MKLLNTREVAERLKEYGISTEAGVRQAVIRGELHPKEGGRGKRYQFTESSVEEFIWRRKWAAGRFVEFPVFREMIERIGEPIRNYFGEDPGCLVALMPDGFPYALVLLWFLVHEKRCDVNLVQAHQEIPVERRLINGRKILIVDDSTRTGSSLDKAKSLIQARKDIKVKEIETFVYDDFKGIADFYVYQRDYEEHLDEINLNLVGESKIDP